MRNINATLNNVDGAPTSGATDRASLARELLQLMTGWPPRDRGVLRSWHRHALSLVYLNVLIALEEEGPLPMKRLAEAMNVSDASATGIVDRMEKRGLVERRHGTEDRRQVLVYRTQAGAQVFRDMADRRSAMLSRILDAMSKEDLEALLRGMRAIHTARQRVMASMGGDTASDGPCGGEPPGPQPPAPQENAAE
jgi:DNA-binding MarR family transcriptional regulator